MQSYHAKLLGPESVINSRSPFGACYVKATCMSLHLSRFRIHERAAEYVFLRCIAKAVHTYDIHASILRKFHADIRGMGEIFFRIQISWSRKYEDQGDILSQRLSSSLSHNVPWERNLQGRRSDKGTRCVLQHTGSVSRMTSGASGPRRNFAYPKKRSATVTWTAGTAGTRRDAKIIWSRPADWINSGATPRNAASSKVRGVIIGTTVVTTATRNTAVSSRFRNVFTRFTVYPFGRHYFHG